MKSPFTRTDQTLCYNASGNIISCTGSGQDGEQQAGMPWPEPRFEINADAVTDFLTGLMWPRNAGMEGFPLSFSEASHAVAEMNAAGTFGFDNWHLPERSELFSLISHARMNPALPEGYPFQNVFPGYYWTATPCARFPRQAWYVHMGGGRVFKGMKQGYYMVWPVRRIENKCIQSSPSESGNFPEKRFIENRCTVTDRHSGLIWTKSADIAKHPVSWEKSLTIVREMNDRNAYGHPDWRLPNIRELESLTDMRIHSPAIAASDIFTDIKDFYWSSTTSVYDPAYAWTMYSEDGNIGVGYKKNPEFHVWCVRGGSVSFI